jgi:hypothetical protein
MASEPKCTIEGCTTHYGCRLRAKGLQVSPRAEMTKTQNWRPTPSVPPSRNKEIIYDERPGGVKVPLMKPDGTVVRRKYYDEHKHQITSTLNTIRATH